MPSYEITWTATVTGVIRVDADNPEEAEQALCHDGDPSLSGAELSDVHAKAIDEV